MQSPGRDLDPRSPPYQDNIRDFFVKYKEDFELYLGEERTINERTNKDYISSLERNLPHIETLNQLRNHLHTIYTDSYGRAMKNLFNFMLYIDQDEFNGISIDRWKKAIKLRSPGVREIYVSDDEIKTAYKNITEEGRPFFKLLMYSGVRLSQTIEGIKRLGNSVIRDDLCRIPVSSISRGNKKVYWIYFPRSFLSEIEKAETPLDHRTYEKHVKFNRVSASTIRKWHLNFLIEHGIPESVADFIQGRASVTVGSAHYLAKTQQADLWYGKVVDKLLDLLK
jgi:intergrase/recombinase